MEVLGESKIMGLSPDFVSSSPHPPKAKLFSLVFFCLSYPEIELDLYFIHARITQGCPGSSNGKESPAMRETWVRFLGWQDPLEKDIATHPSMLAWRIP